MTKPRIVEAGAGVGMLLASSVERELRSGRLVQLPLAQSASLAHEVSVGCVQSATQTGSCVCVPSLGV